MCRTRKPAWRNSDEPNSNRGKITLTQTQGRKNLQPVAFRTAIDFNRIAKNMGKRKEPTWGNTNEPKINRGKRILTHGRKNLKLTFRTAIDANSLSSDEDGSDDDDGVEKLSSHESGMICVEGYKVKRSNATILEAIFKKHGDIAAECVFKTDSMISSILEIICEVVRQVQTNDVIEKIEEIERRVSDAEAVNIDVSWLRAHLEAVNKRNENSKKYSLLMEMKSNTILVKRAAQMDVRETCAELMAAQERFEKAERCARVLHLVEKNLNGSILECKAKLDSWVNHPVV